MPLSFIGLPDDILIQICIRLDPKDLLSITQTCRVLHAFAFSNYVWHHINHTLPLDVSSSRGGGLSSVPAFEIQAATRRALRLDANWRQPVSRILRIDKIHIQPSPMAVDMQPLGANWLVTSHRVRSSLIDICIWRVGTRNGSKASAGILPSSRVIHIKPENAFSFEAAFQEEGGDVAIVAVLGSNDRDKGQLTIYQINLKGHETNENPLGVPYIMHTWKIERTTIFYYAQISGPIIAAGIVNLMDTQKRHRILLFNIKTNATVMVDSPALSAFEPARLRFKLYSPFIVIAGTYQQRIKVQVRELPKSIFSTMHTTDESASEDWEASIVDYETESIRTAEMHISPEPIYSTTLTSFTVVATYSPYAFTENGRGNIYRFPIDTSARNLMFNDWPNSLSFLTPSNATLEPICLGKRGLRAVWLSHQWNTDGFKLMKASFPNGASAQAVVAPLQAPTIALPFESHNCHSLYFDEAKGKVCVGVHTGDIFVLQF